MRIRARLSLACLLVWALWRGTGGLLGLGSELARCDLGKLRTCLSASEEERLESTLEQQDVALGLPRGYDAELFHALAENVEPDGRILVARHRGMPRERNVGAVAVLLFPREMERGIGSVPADWTPSPGTYVLDFDDELRADLEGKLRPVVHAANWTLWR